MTANEVSHIFYSFSPTILLGTLPQRGKYHNILTLWWVRYHIETKQTSDSEDRLSYGFLQEIRQDFNSKFNFLDKYYYSQSLEFLMNLLPLGFPCRTHSFVIWGRPVGENYLWISCPSGIPTRQIQCFYLSRKWNNIENAYCLLTIRYCIYSL